MAAKVAEEAEDPDESEFFLSTSDVPSINAYLKACGTQSTDTPVEIPIPDATARGPQDTQQPSSRGGSPPSNREGAEPDTQ